MLENVLFSSNQNLHNSLMTLGKAELRIPAAPGCDAVLICAYKGLISPGAHQMRVFDGGWTAWLPMQGTVQACVFVNSKWVAAGPGEGLLLPPAPRDHRLTQDTRMLSVRFRLETPSFPIQPPLQPLIPLPHAVRALTQTGRKLVKQLEEWLEPCADRNSPGIHRYLPGEKQDLLGAMRARAAFAEWIAVFFKSAFEGGWQPFEKTGVMDSVVARVAAKLTRFDGPEERSIASIAAKAGVSVSHLRRLFHQSTGVPPAVFRDQARQHEAERRLSTSLNPLKKIAYDLGFASPSHFTNWFRTRTGQSPSTHRANARLPGV